MIKINEQQIPRSYTFNYNDHSNNLEQRLEHHFLTQQQNRRAKATRGVTTGTNSANAADKNKFEGITNFTNQIGRGD